MHALLGINSQATLITNPKLGASWEGFALESIIRHHRADPEDCYFWAIHQQMELDLLITKENRKIGFEFKYTDRPKLTKSMQQSYDLLNLEQLTLIYPGKISFPLAENIQAVGLEKYLA